jgi:addiction module RelE/StbE family toxin
MMLRAEHDLDEIYDYLAKKIEVPEIAMNLVDELEEAILSLENMPYRGSERKVGSYANRGYRQIYVKNFTIIYRIDENRHFVIIVTVRYTPSNF